MNANTYLLWFPHCHTNTLYVFTNTHIYFVCITKVKGLYNEIECRTQALWRYGQAIMFYDHIT